MKEEKYSVSINSDQIKTVLKKHIDAAIARRVASSTFTHHNTDGVYTPAQWFFGANLTEPRHSMTTSGSMSWDNGTLTVSLNYTVITI